MASGKPVVVSDIPGVREVITDGREGVLADPMDPEDLGGKIRILLADDRKRAEMGRAGRGTVEKDFSVEGVVGRIEKGYLELVGKRGPLQGTTPSFKGFPVLSHGAHVVSS